MILQNMREIESDEFAIRLNVASDFKGFVKAAGQQRAVRELLGEIISPGAKQAVVSRVFELSRQSVDPRYENPWDTALGVYLVLLDACDLQLSKMAAEMIRQAPQCWWAGKFSNYILQRNKLTSDAVSQEYIITPSDVTFMRGSEDIILQTPFIPSSSSPVKVRNATHSSSSGHTENLLSQRFTAESTYFACNKAA